MKHLLRISILFVIMGINLACEKENQSPIIQSNTASPQTIKTGEITQLTCVATDPDGDELTYLWSSEKGIFINGTVGESVPWQAPQEPGDYSISIIVNDGKTITEGTVNTTVEANPQLAVSPESISFGPDETEKIIQIRNSGTGTLTWNIIVNSVWLNVDTISGETTNEIDKIVLSVSREEVDPGIYDGSVTVVSNSGEMELNISMEVEDNTFLDIRDGKEYRWIKTGEQIWMAENLAYYIGAGCWAYNDDEYNALQYGRLYTWDAARRACPFGWHLPTDEEWEELAEFINEQEGPFDKISDDWVGLGKYLKTTIGWFEENNGTDDFGFGGLPGGDRNNDGNFYYIRYFGHWWSATDYDDDKAYRRSLYYTDSTFFRGLYYKDYAFSVRCIKNE